MTAHEILETRLRIMQMALEISRLERHGAFNMVVENPRSISDIYDELSKKLKLEELI